jgi:hypothetical protein
MEFHPYFKIRLQNKMLQQALSRKVPQRGINSSRNSRNNHTECIFLVGVSHSTFKCSWFHFDLALFTDQYETKAGLRSKVLIRVICECTDCGTELNI